MAQTGQIFKIHSDFYYVNHNNQTFECKLREVLKKQKLKIVVGDFVEFEMVRLKKFCQRKTIFPDQMLQTLTKS